MIITKREIIIYALCTEIVNLQYLQNCFLIHKYKWKQINWHDILQITSTFIFESTHI